MSKAGKRIIEGLNEALAWVRGETAVKVTRFVDGKPQSRRMTINEYLDLPPDPTPPSEGALATEEKE